MLPARQAAQDFLGVVVVGWLADDPAVEREFAHRDGMPLLAAGQVLSARLIERMQDYEATQGGGLTVFIHG